MRFLLLMVLIVGVSFSISEEEINKDRSYLDRVEERLEVMDRKLLKGKLSREEIGELNSFGYPLSTLRDKYRSSGSESHGDISSRADSLYKKLMYVKRGVFPELLKREVNELKLPVCKIEAEGRERKSLRVGLKDPKDEEVVLKLMTETQLQHAHLIGIEAINFEKCRP